MGAAPSLICHSRALDSEPWTMGEGLETMSTSDIVGSDLHVAMCTANMRRVIWTSQTMQHSLPSRIQAVKFKLTSAESRPRQPNLVGGILTMRQESCRESWTDSQMPCCGERSPGSASEAGFWEYVDVLPGCLHVCSHFPLPPFLERFCFTLYSFAAGFPVGLHSLARQEAAQGPEARPAGALQ